MERDVKTVPAFPSQQGECQDGSWNQTYCEGMTLRDWFAGQVLMGSSAKWGNPISADCIGRANACYAMADAMLAARANP